MSDEPNTPGEGADGTQGTETPEQGAGNVSPEDVGAIVANALKDFAQGPLNAALTAHSKRVDKRFSEADAAREAQEQAAADTDSTESAADLAMKKMQTQLNKVTDQLTSERTGRQRADREGKLREFLSDKVSDVSVAMSYFRDRLKVDTNGDFYGEDGTGGIVSWDDAVQKGIAATPTLQKATGKSGGGGSEKATGLTTQGKVMTQAEYAKKVVSLGEVEQGLFMTQVAHGEVLVQGINDG